MQGNTLLHAVNNYWYDNSGHAFEVRGCGKGFPVGVVSRAEVLKPSYEAITNSPVIHRSVKAHTS
jgi:pectin lyase